MNPELDALLQAYDAAKQVAEDAENELLATYETRLAGVLQRYPGLSRAALERTIQFAYGRWLKAQDKPTSLPPKA